MADDTKAACCAETLFAYISGRMDDKDVPAFESPMAAGEPYTVPFHPHPASRRGWASTGTAREPTSGYDGIVGTAGMDTCSSPNSRV